MTVLYLLLEHAQVTLHDSVVKVFSGMCAFCMVNVASSPTPDKCLQQVF